MLGLGKRSEFTQTCNFPDLYNYSPEVSSFYASGYITDAMWEFDNAQYLVNKYSEGMDRREGRRYSETRYKSHQSQ